MFLSKDDSDFLHDEEVTNPLAKIWHRSCPSLEIVSFPDSIWYVVFLFSSLCTISWNDVISRVRNARLGWVTLKELERILFARERDLEQKEKDLAEREKALLNWQFSLKPLPRNDLYL